MENYSKAKTLATIEHHGEQFRIVRRRWNGKPAQGLVMVHGATFVAPLKEGFELEALRAGLALELAKHFPTRESLLESLAPILERYKPTLDNPNNLN